MDNPDAWVVDILAFVAGALRRRRGVDREVGREVLVGSRT